MLPARRLLDLQAAWLAPTRARALRQVDIGRRRRVLDLGCGFGVVTEELQRRCGGTAIAFDVDKAAVRQAADARVAGRAEQLPFATGSLDLVFTQFSLLWMPPDAIGEAARVLATDGVLVAIEPDYDGLIEWPEPAITRDLWLAALTRAGAEPRIGRQLPDRLNACGLQVTVELLNTLVEPSPARLDFLRDLPLTDLERARLATTTPATVAHLPVFIVTAWRRH